MATTLLSLPAPHQKTLFSQRPYTNINAKTWSLTSTTALIRYSYPSNRPVVALSSSSSSTTTSSVVEDVPPSPPVSSPDALPDQSDSASEDPRMFPLSGCKACGKQEIEKGCNGEGRIQGGIATVPGFGWWPIKAYRPCPAFVASGGRYRRQGQSMDEVVSGKGLREVPGMTDSEIETRKEGRDQRGFKR